MMLMKGIVTLCEIVWLLLLFLAAAGLVYGIYRLFYTVFDGLSKGGGGHVDQDAGGSGDQF